MPCDEDDLSVLRALYESTNGTGWTENRGWESLTNSSAELDCCTWDRITCDASHRVFIV